MTREFHYDQQLGWWLREPDDEYSYAYRANIRGVFFARRGSAVGVDLRKVKQGTTLSFTRPQTFIADAKTAAAVLPRLLDQRCPTCAGAQLRLHSEDTLPAEQVACLGCGGMYDLPTFVEQQGYPLATCWGLRLEGRWSPGDDRRAAALAPLSVSAKGAQACEAALAVARACQPVAFAAEVIDDRGLAALGPQPRLEALRLWYTRITDQGLATVARLSSLRELNAGNNAGITDAGIERLAALGGLTTLNLEQTALGDAGLAALARLPALRSLSMARTRISDAGLRALRDHPGLEEIDIASNPISDAGIEHLATIPNLRSVTAYSTRVRATKRYGFLR